MRSSLKQGLRGARRTYSRAEGLGAVNGARTFLMHRWIERAGEGAGVWVISKAEGEVMT
jgi:hypothetical protein